MTVESVVNPEAERFAPVWSWLAFIVPFAVYACSLQSSVAYWDTGEMQTVPYILGIAHPTGFPLFVLSGWLFTHVVPFGSVAWRMSLLSALAMALAARLVYSLARLLNVAPFVAAAASVLFAVGEIAWSRGTRAEVHSFAVALAAAALVAAVRWYRTTERRALWWLGLAVGFGLATHLLVALLLPGIAALVLARARELRVRDGLACVALAVAPLLLYLYLPLRSVDVYQHRLDPTLTLGLPPGKPYWDYGHPSTLSALVREIAGSDFDVGNGIGGVVRPRVYQRILGSYGPLAARELGVFGFAAALFGLGSVALVDPLLVAALCVSAFVPVLFALGYSAESDVERYYLTSFWLLAAFAAIGLARLGNSLSGGPTRRGSLLAGSALAGVALVVAFTNRDLFAQPSDPGAGPYIDRIIARTPPNAVVIATWAFSTPLAYAAYVDGRMQQRIVETNFASSDASYLGGWIRTRPVYVVSPFLPTVAGFHFKAVDGGDPLLLKVTR